MVIAALFTIARTWKQSRCPLTDEWIKKLWHIYAMEYYWAIKRNVFESVLMSWMNLKPIIQKSEVSQKEKYKYHVLMHIYIVSRKMILMYLFSVQQWRNRYRKQTYGHGGRGGGRRWDRCMERVTCKFTIPYIKQIGICCVTQGTQTGALWQAEGRDWREMEGRSRREGTWVYLYLSGP